MTMQQDRKTGMSEARRWVRVGAAMACLVTSNILGLISGGIAWALAMEGNERTWQTGLLAATAILAWTVWFAFWVLAYRAASDMFGRGRRISGLSVLRCLLLCAMGAVQILGLQLMVLSAIALGPILYLFE